MNDGISDEVFLVLCGDSQGNSGQGGERSKG